MRRVPKEDFRYLDVSRKDRLWNLYLNATGRTLHRMPSLPDCGHPAPYYYLWDEGRTLSGYGVGYVTQGKGEFETEESGRLTLEAGAMFLLFPGVWHRYRPMAKTGWSYHWLHFDGDYINHLVQNSLITPRNPVLKIGLNSQVLRPFLALYRRVEVAPPGLQQLAAANIIEILGSALSAPPPHEEEDGVKSIISAAKATLEQQVDSPIDLKQLADSFGMSYNYFRIIFKEQIGIAPYQYYLNLRLERAKELLQGTDMTIKEIALSLQFDAPNYFGRIFGRKTGMAPSKWRELSRRAGHLPENHSHLPE